MRKIIAAVLLFSYTFSVYASDSSRILQELQENMRSVNTVQADFTQEKTIQMFAKPITIKGSLYLQKPDRFSWRTSSPMQYNLVMVGNNLKQWDSESRQVQEFSLSKNPAFSAALAQMNGWFNGDYVTLGKDYDFSIVAAKPLVLLFTPKSSSLAAGMIENVKVFFREDKKYLSRIEIREKNSDMTVIIFSNTKINVPVRNAVWEVKRRV